MRSPLNTSLWECWNFPQSFNCKVHVDAKFFQSQKIFRSTIVAITNWCSRFASGTSTPFSTYYLLKMMKIYWVPSLVWAPTQKVQKFNKRRINKVCPLALAIHQWVIFLRLSGWRFFTHFTRVKSNDVVNSTHYEKDFVVWCTLTWRLLHSGPMAWILFSISTHSCPVKYSCLYNEQNRYITGSFSKKRAITLAATRSHDI